MGREPVEPSPEVGLEPLPAGAGAQGAQGELRCVVERLARRCPQGGLLLDHPGLVEQRLHVEHRLLGVLEHRVQPAQDGHRQDDVAVLAADVQIAQDIVGDAPDVVRNPVQVGAARRHRASDRQSWRQASRPALAADRTRDAAQDRFDRLLERQLLQTGLSPGLEIGRILKAVYERQLDEEVTSLEEATAAARRVTGNPPARGTD